MNNLLASLTLVLGVLLAAPDLAAQAHPPAEELVAEAAEPWLELVDEGRLQESWDRAAPVFQEGMNSQQWVQMMGQVRGALGDVVSRRLHRAEFSSSPPNAPPGEYLIVEFMSEFERLPRAMEAVALMLMEDGSWKVAGSFLQPAP